MSMLDVRELTVRYGDTTIVKDVSFTVDPGQWLMLVGPNGAGKSTIVSAISQGTAYQGQVLFQGKDIRHYRANELARQIGVLTQHHAVGYSFTVGEVVRLGRYAYSPGLFSGRQDADETIVEEAMELTGVAGLADQSVLTLSGGELQRTFLAQIFAQDPKLLILDEPTNHLDLVYQKQIFGLVRTWLEGEGRAVVSVVHDLSLARAYGTHALLMERSRPLAFGAASEVFTQANMDRAYGMDVRSWMLELLGQWQ